MTASTTASRETLGFQTEVKQLLHLMIHSLYSNREIFLRELVSNASDACDKLRFEALHNDALYENQSDLNIRVSFDKEARTLTIADSGIGMSRDEVIANLGTIAKSGTRDFFSKLSGDQKKDAHLIGQFGVGFYSAFIVADKVSVLTRRAGEKADQGVRWESDGGGEFSVEMVEKAARGTEITLHLREGQDDLLAGYKLREIIKKYSNHIVQPILMQKEEWKDGGYVTLDEDETVNQASALWAKSKNEITEEQYKEFYKHVGHDFDDPLAWTHARVEGKQEYTQLLYIPGRAPFDMYDRQARHGIKLYVRRVFIMDDAEQLMPQYMRFVRGVVDSADLPLNVSREILQESKDIEAIRKGCTGKVLGLLADLAENDKEKYAKFWGEFGQVLKEGVGEDFANKDKIAALLRFATTKADTAEESVSLKDYIARMKDGQDKIYYVTADNFQRRQEQPAPRSVPQERHRSAAALQSRGRVGGEQPARIRRQVAGLRRQGRPRPRRAGRRSRKEGTGKAGRRIQAAHRKDQDQPRGQGQGSARHPPPHRQPRLPRGGRARHERQPRAPAQGRRTESAHLAAHPRDQPVAPRGATPQG